MHHNLAGLCYEQDESAILPDWREPLSLPPALLSALQRFSFRDCNLRDRKSSDWTAYRASQCRSVREFERSYLRITVRPANDAELCYIAEAKPLDESEVTLRITLDRTGGEEMGRRLLRLYDICSKWSSVAR